jgi:hypothetical protein
MHTVKILKNQIIEKYAEALATGWVIPSGTNNLKVF